MAIEVDINEETKGLKKDVTSLNTIMIGVVIVLFLGFISLLVTVLGLAITYQHDNSKAFIEYKNELQLQNEKIDSLRSALEPKS